MGDATEISHNYNLRSRSIEHKQDGSKEPSKSNSKAGVVQSSQDAKVESGETTKSFIIVAAIFLSALCVMLFVYYSFPELEEDEKQHIKLPRDLDDAKALGKVLSRYNDKYYYQVMAGFFCTYILYRIKPWRTFALIMYHSLQTFAIPGSISLSILSGFLFPFPLALFLVCLCSATGASNCYLLSHLVGVKLVMKYIPDRVEKWSSAVARHREHLLNYIIFLRITPFLPNWFINITSPVLKVPLWPFFLGTFLGVAPPSFVAIQAGTTLYQLTHAGDAVSWTSVIVLAILAVLSILPAIFKQYLRKKFE